MGNNTVGYSWSAAMGKLKIPKKMGEKKKCKNCGETKDKHTELGHCLNFGKKITVWKEAV